MHNNSWCAPLYSKQEGSKVIVSIKTTEPVFMEQKCKYYSVRHDLGRETRWKRISTIASSWLRALSLAPARSLAEISSKPETRSRWSVNLFSKCSTCLIHPLWTNSSSWEPKLGEVYATHWWKILLETEPLNDRLKFNIQSFPAEPSFHNAYLKVSVFRHDFSPLMSDYDFLTVYVICDI